MLIALSSASPKRSITTAAESNKSPKTGNHTELDDADLLEYDKEDALSTVHEAGIEDDLDDPEIQDSLLVQPEVSEPAADLRQPPRQESEGTPCAAAA